MNRYIRAKFGDISTAGKRLKVERLRLGFTIVEMAEAINWNKQSWSCWERDVGDPPIRMSGWEMLARLGFDVQFIITGESAPDLNFVWRYLAEMSVRERLENMTAEQRRIFLLDLLREVVE